MPIERTCSVRADAWQVQYISHGAGKWPKSSECRA
jgi:hypothetical protein